MPCLKLGIRLGDPRFPRKFLAAARPGAYLRIIEEGDVGAGDAIEVVLRPDHGVTMRRMVAAYWDRAEAAALWRVDRLPEFWRRVAAGR